MVACCCTGGTISLTGSFIPEPGDIDIFINWLAGEVTPLLLIGASCNGAGVYKVDPGATAAVAAGGAAEGLKIKYSTARAATPIPTFAPVVIFIFAIY
jgi:hypothetical protein